MTTMRRDRLIDDYLARLEAAVAHLPRDRRRELVGEIREHVDAGAAAGGAPPERGGRESVGLLVLALSFFLPLAGYLIGAGLVLASNAWDARDKLIGLLLVPAVVVTLALIVLVFVEIGGAYELGFDHDGFIISLTLLAGYVLPGLAAAAYLSRRLRRL